MEKLVFLDVVMPDTPQIIMLLLLFIVLPVVLIIVSVCAFWRHRQKKKEMSVERLGEENAAYGRKGE